MLALVFSAPSALPRRLQAQESPCIGLSDDSLTDAKGESPPATACGMYLAANPEEPEPALCRNGVRPTGTISITQREVAKARVSASGAQNIWVTNEYGTVLAWFVGGDNNRDMDLDEEWGQAMQLTGHASYADGTCASATVDTYQKMVDDFMSGDGYFYEKATNPAPSLTYANGVISFTCNDCVAPFEEDAGGSCILAADGVSDDVCGTCNEDADCHVRQGAECSGNTCRNTVCGADGASKVGGTCPGIKYVKDAAGNVLYASTARRFTITANNINTLRSPSVLSACFEPGKCAEVDVVSDAIDAITGACGGNGQACTETDEGAASLTFYGRCSSFVGGNKEPCTLAVPVRPPAPACPPPAPACPACPPTPAIAPFPNAAPLRTHRSRSTARVR